VKTGGVLGVLINVISEKGVQFCCDVVLRLIVAVASFACNTLNKRAPSESLLDWRCRRTCVRQEPHFSCVPEDPVEVR
jgi:hypothetical protein